MLQLLYAGGVKSGKDTERNRDHERMQPYYNRYLRCTFKRIHVGLTEVGVAKMMMEECAKRNVVTAFGNPPEYPLVLNPKGGMSHRDLTTSTKIEAGDMLVIDFSIRYNGYTSDIARTMYFLKPGEEHAPQGCG